MKRILVSVALVFGWLSFAAAGVACPCEGAQAKAGAQDKQKPAGKPCERADGKASAGHACDQAAPAEAQKPAGAVKRSKDAVSVTIPVEGMHCGRCGTRVSAALRSVGGVDDAQVNVEKKQAVVVYDAKKVKPAELVAKINQLGFKAGTPSQPPKS